METKAGIQKQTMMGQKEEQVKKGFAVSLRVVVRSTN